MKFLPGFKSDFFKRLSNIPGWSTKKKIIVFLVDDWGSIRIPDIAARKALIKAGIDCESNRFDRFDTLESADDLSALFEVLINYHDANGQPAKFTAVTVVANPDFNRIRQSDFKEYYYEPFTRTLEKYYNEDVLKIWKQGIEEGIFIPQFHGREHLNVNIWLDGLRNNDNNLLEAFNQKAIGVPVSSTIKTLNNYMAAFDFESDKDLPNLQQICQEGLLLFEKIFGFRATLFTAPSLIHNRHVEPYLAELGIKYIDRAKITIEPIGFGNSQKKYFWLGKKNHFGQLYLTRNCMFEPNIDQNKDSTNQTLHEIDIAFRMRKPAIISSHRVNFSGQVDPENRDMGLKALRNLLNAIVKNWPEVEFVSGSELGEIILNQSKNDL